MNAPGRVRFSRAMEIIRPGQQVMACEITARNIRPIFGVHQIGVEIRFSPRAGGDVAPCPQFDQPVQRYMPSAALTQELPGLELAGQQKLAFDAGFIDANPFSRVLPLQGRNVIVTDLAHVNRFSSELETINIVEAVYAATPHLRAVKLLVEPAIGEWQW